MRSLWWLAGQFLLVAVGGALIIAAVVATWYALSMLVLVTVGRLFPLSGRKRKPRARAGASTRPDKSV
jgi:hypothetical protein